MEVADGLEYLEETTSVADLSSFMIFGGEAMLYPRRTVALFGRASEIGIPVIQLITNGAWADDPEMAHDLALQLKDAGVNDVLISVDAFHLPHIPLRGPRNAGEACLDVGMEKIRWNVCVVEDIEADNQYDRETRRILGLLEPMGIEPDIERVEPEGRAPENLGSFFRRQPLEGMCPNRKGLISPSCITLDPDGWVSMCHSLAMGNAKETRLSRILLNHDHAEHPVMRILVEKGPLGLLDLPDSQGFRLNEERYITKCLFCLDVRRFMKEAYPGIYA